MNTKSNYRNCINNLMKLIKIKNLKNKLVLMRLNTGENNKKSILIILKKFRGK